MYAALSRKRHITARIHSRGREHDAPVREKDSASAGGRGGVENAVGWESESESEIESESESECVFVCV